MKHNTRLADNRLRLEVLCAKRAWPKQVAGLLRYQLEHLISQYRFAVSDGDLAIIHGKWYVTHSGLLRLAARSRCRGIRTQILVDLCDKAGSRWTFRATAFTSMSCRGFVGYGDADPSNVSPLVHGAEMRIAETRAVNRALRKAYGIGICSVEELGSLAAPPARERPVRKLPPESSNGNGSCAHSTGSANDGNGGRIRDRLCQLIRQHELDAELVKFYAIDFCGTKTLREASREQIEAFVTRLADWARTDRNALLCQLNSYRNLQDRATARQESAA